MKKEPNPLEEMYDYTCEKLYRSGTRLLKGFTYWMLFFTLVKAFEEYNHDASIFIMGMMIIPGLSAGIDFSEGLVETILMFVWYRIERKKFYSGFYINQIIKEFGPNADEVDDSPMWIMTQEDEDELFS